jgi:hypothetical protein
MCLHTISIAEFRVGAENEHHEPQYILRLACESIL